MFQSLTVALCRAGWWNDLMPGTKLGQDFDTLSLQTKRLTHQTRIKHVESPRQASCPCVLGKLVDWSISIAWETEGQSLTTRTSHPMAQQRNRLPSQPAHRDLEVGRNQSCKRADQLNLTSPTERPFVFLPLS